MARRESVPESGTKKPKPRPPFCTRRRPCEFDEEAAFCPFVGCRRRLVERSRRLSELAERLEDPVYGYD